MEAQESSEAPERGGAEENDKGKSREAAGGGSSAPRLEHGHESNGKDQNGGNGEGFQPHKTPRTAKHED